VSPRIFATAQADRGFLPAPPPLLSPEPSLAFVRRSSRPPSSFIRETDPLDAGVVQERFIGLAAKAAIGGDDLRGPRDCLSMTRKGCGQQAAIFRIPHVDLVMRDHPIFRFSQQCFVPKLGLHAQLPAPNRARLWIKNAHDPIGDRRRAADAGAGLVHDLGRHLQLAPQAQPGALDQSGRPALDMLPEVPTVAQHALRLSADLPRVPQYARRLCQHCGFRFLRAHAQTAADRGERSLDTPRAGANGRVDGHPSGVKLADGSRHHPRTVSQQADVRGIVDGGLYHRRIDAQFAAPQELPLAGVLDQEAVQLVHDLGPVLPSQLAERGRVRDRGVQRQMAETPPMQTVRHFPHQNLIAQPIPVLQVHQPQIRFDGYRRPADQRAEALQVRIEESLIRQVRIDGRQLGAEGPRPRWQQLIPQRALRIPQPQHGRPRKEEQGTGARRSDIGIPSPARRIGVTWPLHQFDTRVGNPIILPLPPRKNSDFIRVCAIVFHGELARNASFGGW